MKRSIRILIILALALVPVACFLPGAFSSSDGTKRTSAPLFDHTMIATITPQPSPSTTNTQPVPTATVATTATPANIGGTGGGGIACIYRATFISDATVPDDTVVTGGSTFVKTWMVRNDGTCAWGPDGYGLRTLTFTGGSQMGAPAVIPLHATVAPGQTIDVSVTMTAPETPGTYVSNWMFRVDNAPNGAGPNLGVGPNGDQPLYARIRVSGSSDLTRLQFQPGTTSTIVTGDLGASETRGYLVAAQQGQVIIAGTALSDWEGGVRVKITTKDNVILPDLLPNLAVAASLPATQDYIVWVTGGGYATSYHLAVTIPIRINFASGTDSASLDGTIVTGDDVWYILRASAGQTLTASVQGSNVDMSITALQNPQVLVTSTNDWTGTLPDTQDYLIQVSPSVPPTTYTLNVTIR